MTVRNKNAIFIVRITSNEIARTDLVSFENPSQTLGQLSALVITVRHLAGFYVHLGTLVILALMATLGVTKSMKRRCIEGSSRICKLPKLQSMSPCHMQMTSP